MARARSSSSSKRRRRRSLSASSSGARDSGLEPTDDVIDGVADRLQVLEVLVLDPEADGSLAQLLLDGLDQLDQGQGVGLEVIGERLALGDPCGIDLQDVGQAVTDQLEDLLPVEGTTLHMGLCGHAT